MQCLKVFTNSFYSHQGGNGTTCEKPYHANEINKVVSTNWTSKSIHYFRFYRQKEDAVKKACRRKITLYYRENIIWLIH